MKEDSPSLFERVLLQLAGARVLILFVFHAVVFAAAYALSYLLRFDFVIWPGYVDTFKASLLVVVGIQLLVGVVFGFYRGWWRYVGIGDVVRLVVGLSTALVLLVGLWYVGGTFGIHERFIRSPRGVLLIDWAFSLLALFGTRVLIRLGRDRFRPQEMPLGSRRVLIVGAGDAGETLAREIEHRPQLGMKVVGFVDDQRAKWGAHIRGIKVTGPIATIGSIADVTNADEALLAIPSASGNRIREIIRQLSEADLTFKTIPAIDHLVSGKVHVSQLRPVNIEDLLRRKKTELPGDPVRQLFKGKRVLITGAGGTIGSELSSQVLEFEPERIILIERSEYALYEAKKRLETQGLHSKICSILTDIRHREGMEELIALEAPQIVLHAAAHKHVPLGEENPAEYLRNNTIATRSLAETCARYDVERFVFVSTDKAINPTSVMGATKRAAEILLLDLASQCAMKVNIVRFGNVIGSSGSVTPLFMEQIAAGGPVTVTHPDATRYFIRTSEAISLVLQAATLGNDGQVFTLDMGEPIKIVELARDLIRLSNNSASDIPIVFIGLRPGEKIAEQIRLTGEQVSPTLHPQIMVTESPQYDRETVARWIRSAVLNPDPIASLKQLVSEYNNAAKSEPTDGFRETSAVTLPAAAPLPS